MSSDWQKKVWGKTRCIVDTSFYSKHELKLKKGGVCSFHYHTLRQNRFFVASGMIKVVWAFGKEVDSVTLGAGESWDIKALIPHQFQILESGIVFEEYFSDRGGEISNGDICRLTVGCKPLFIQDDSEEDDFNIIF